MKKKSTKSTRVSNKALAAVALTRAGLADLRTISDAVGLSVEQVEQIEAAEEPGIRHAAAVGLPPEFVFRLKREITCPRCGNRIYLVPCLVCKIADFQNGFKKRAAKRRKGEDYGT